MFCHEWLSLLKTLLPCHWRVRSILSVKSQPLNYYYHTPADITIDIVTPQLTFSSNSEDLRHKAFSNTNVLPLVRSAQVAEVCHTTLNIDRYWSLWSFSHLACLIQRDSVWNIRHWINGFHCWHSSVQEVLRNLSLSKVQKKKYRAIHLCLFSTNSSIESYR